MNDKNKLKCPNCGGSLDISVSYDGCDWNSVKGEKSGFDYEISLVCSKCGCAYGIGRVKSFDSFCENIEKLRPYGKKAQTNDD